MPQVHPTAILQGEVNLADDVVIGPQCTLIGPVTLGPGCQLMGHVYLHGPLTMGANNRVWPFACLGFAPQDFKWNPDEAGAGVRIGSGNMFRENMTVHRATSHQTPTTIGDNNLFMAAGHLGHDVQLGNHCVFANAAMLGGHVRVDDRVIIGGCTPIHQHVRLGRGAILSGGAAAGYDVPPFFLLSAINLIGSINIIGLRRSGASRATIDSVRWVYRTLYRRGLPHSAAVEALRERADDPLVAEYIEFITTSRRGICSGTAKAARGMARLQAVDDAAASDD